MWGAELGLIILCLDTSGSMSVSGREGVKSAAILLQATLKREHVDGVWGMYEAVRLLWLTPSSSPPFLPLLFFPRAHVSWWPRRWRWSA